MSGTVIGPGEVVMGPVADERQPGLELPPETEPSVDEGTWTAARALRKLSQLTFAYGISAVFAGLSAVVMSALGNNADWTIAAAVLPFVISLVISAYIFTDLLEFLWDGVAGRLVDRRGPWAHVWLMTLVLLLIGMLALAVGIVLTVLAFGMTADFGFLTPEAVVALTVCGLAILMAVVLPAAALGPRLGRRLATVAAGVGSVAVAAEGAVTITDPFGSNPLLGWMEGTFPLLNWNVGFAALIALSAFLIWLSYRLLLPPVPEARVPG